MNATTDGAPEVSLNRYVVSIFGHRARSRSRKATPRATELRAVIAAGALALHDQPQPNR